MNVKLLLTLFFLFFTTSVFANDNDSIIVFKGNETQPTLIGNHLFIFKDSTKKLSFEEVEKTGVFIQSKTQVPNLGVDESVFWIRFQISNQSNDDDMLLVVEDALIKDVALFTKNDSSFSCQNISKDLPFSTRKNDQHYAQFLLTQPIGNTQTYYLRIHGFTQLVIPVKLGTDETIFTSTVNNDVLSSLYFGVMLVMFLYNLFIYISVKDRSYLYYILYILSVALVQLSVTGLGFKYLWPKASSFEQESVFIFPSLTAFTSIAFFRRFLNSKELTPKADKLMWLFVAGYFITLYNAFFGNKWLAYNLLNLNALPLALFMIFLAAFIKWKFNYRPASFFLLAWTVFLGSIIVFVLKDVGVLPYNLLTVSSIQIGSAVETVLLSIALADRINTLKKDKEKSQKETLIALQENDRIIREQNVILEAKVIERTQELHESNHHLEKTLVDLQEKETALVEAEKMASLGQLTAGIAHEINNPINFVTSNVNPLKRDVSLLIEIIEQMEVVATNEMATTEKLENINALKQTNDYDYLKMEIDHLIKGIGEGATRTAEIVKGLRVFTRLDEDDLKRADVNEGLKSTIIIINHLLNNVIEVETHFANLPMIECYPGKLNQVFLNIMSNAIYAIQKRWKHEKGGKLTIETLHGESKIIIKISDNGTGMDEATKKKIFEPFFTTKDVGEGTGLGMSIAYNTIKKHNGTIEVISEPNQGTSFVMVLPILQA